MQKSNKPLNLFYQNNYITTPEKTAILNYIYSLHPIWEMRYPEGTPDNRQLLRPVYWLGNWQFACLDYYHPPKGIFNRSVTAEDFPLCIQKVVDRIESKARSDFDSRDVPRGWELNTCLINFYGNRMVDGKKHDFARVGEHKDFEPGPVGSVSFGEKALFQFVDSAGKNAKSRVVLQQWLEDSSVQIFGGDKFKKKLFHRVQRVEEKGFVFKQARTGDFETRRINLTFRYVPREHFVKVNRLPEDLQKNISPYIDELAKHSEFWKSQK
ncbi:MAG: alpha-ketoglutarate-dependent dioxygenase AlkB [Bdellovibrionaceae bacterium]|nr:alpha-ketoglutarate-dependent dioxygenase AlkB [Pseudobdellovibrionaceae bacterium]